MRPIRRELMMIFQDPYASLNQRKRVGFIVAEALQVHKIGTPAEIKRRVQELLDVVGPQPGALQPLPARVLRRAAAADRRRPRARGQPEADRLRRAGVGARRLRAGADPQPAQGPAARLRPHVRLHRARPQRRPAHLRPGAGDVPRQGRRDRRRQPALRGAEAPVHGRAALGRADPEPRARPLRGRSCSRATCPTRSTRPRRAGSIRAARASGRATATSTRRSSAASAPGTARPATTRSSAGRCPARRSAGRTKKRSRPG